MTYCTGASLPLVLLETWPILSVQQRGEGETPAAGEGEGPR